MSYYLVSILGRAASNLIYASIVRGLVLAFVWLSAPPLLFVVLSWLLLRDTDFTTLLVNQVPGYDSIPEEYYFCGRVCWITGATSAIGQELAARLARQGALLIVSGRNRAKLTGIAERCKRAYLVSQIRSRRRSDAEVHNIVEEVSNQCTTRVLEIPLDMSDPAAVSQALKTALAWRGRIDALFNNAGLEGKPALVPESQQVSSQMMISCMAPLTLARAAVAAALRPAPCDGLGVSNAVLRFPHLQRLSTQVIGTIGPAAQPLSSPQRGGPCDSPISRLGSLSSAVQQLSRRGAEYSCALVRQCRAFQFAQRVVLGANPKPPTRTFHLVNTMSLVSRLGLPGHGASGASKAALDAFCRSLQKEVACFASCFGQHSTEVVVTSCFLHGIQNGIDCEPAASLDPPGTPVRPGAPCRPVAHTNALKITTDRCAELIIRAARHCLHECWIAKHPYLLYAYVAYYMPWVWRYCSYRFLDRRNFLAVWNQEQADASVQKGPLDPAAGRAFRSGSTGADSIGSESISSTCATATGAYTVPAVEQPPRLLMSDKFSSTSEIGQGSRDL